MKIRRQYNGVKRNRLTRFARGIWGEDPLIARSKTIENRMFREFFGYLAVVVLSVWRRL